MDESWMRQWKMDVWLDCDLKNKANIMTDPICLHHLAKKNVGSWNSYKKFAMRKYLERFFALHYRAG